MDHQHAAEASGVFPAGGKKKKKTKYTFLTAALHFHFLLPLKNTFSNSGTPRWGKQQENISLPVANILLNYHGRRKVCFTHVKSKIKKHSDEPKNH